MAQSNGRTQGIAMKVAVGDPDAPGNVIRPNADGSINVAVSGGAFAVASAAPPSYDEDEAAPLSMDLAGNLRVSATLDPTGLATSALQNTGNTSLATLVTQGADTTTVNVAPDSNAMMLGDTPVTPKFAVISASSSGDNTLVAAVPTKKIRVLAYNFIAAGAVNVRFQTAAAGAGLTGIKTIDAASKGLVAPYNPVGWFETVAGDLLNLELSGAVLVGGELVYIEV